MDGDKITRGYKLQVFLAAANTRAGLIFMGRVVANHLATLHIILEVVVQRKSVELSTRQHGPE